jgi:hypothetical protein
MTINPLFDAAGRVGGVVLALRDIQQIHELREQLKGQSAFSLHKSTFRSVLASVVATA